jgi:hypothetical protein
VDIYTGMSAETRIAQREGEAKKLKEEKAEKEAERKGEKVQRDTLEALKIDARKYNNPSDFKKAFLNLQTSLKDANKVKIFHEIINDEFGNLEKFYNQAADKGAIKKEIVQKEKEIKDAEDKLQSAKDDAFGKGLPKSDIKESVQLGEEHATEEKRIGEPKKKSVKQIAAEMAKVHKMAMEIPATIGIDTPERIALREKIADELYGTGAKNKEKRIDIVMGLTGSGKSSQIGHSLAEQYGSMIIDSDLAKVKLPEYNKGIGTQAVHKESSLISEGSVHNRQDS